MWRAGAAARGSWHRCRCYAVLPLSSVHTRSLCSEQLRAGAAPRPVPVVSIVGRPNVGKSTLFNQLTRSVRMQLTRQVPRRKRGRRSGSPANVQSTALTSSTAGTTRDRIFAKVPLDAARAPWRGVFDACMLVDTGGVVSSNSKSESAPREHRRRKIGSGEVASGSALSSEIRQQVERAVLDSDAVLLVTDVADGVTVHDKQTVQWLRSLQRKERKAQGVGRADDDAHSPRAALNLMQRVVVVVNKVDNEDRLENVPRFRTLGFSGDPIPMSAAHNDACEVALHAAIQRVWELDYEGKESDDTRSTQDNDGLDVGEGLDEEKASWSALQPPVLPEESENGQKHHSPKSMMANLEKELGSLDPLERVFAAQKEKERESGRKGKRSSLSLPPRIAIVGRPNVGKSSLLNVIVRDSRAVVSSIPGTTMDPVDSNIQWGDDDVTLVDTAGVRRRGRNKIGLESLAVMWAMGAIDLSETVLLVIDAQQGVVGQDKRIAAMALERYRSIVVVVNKWDGLIKKRNTRARYEKMVRRELGFLKHMPIAFSSTLSGDTNEIDEAMNMALAVMKQRRTRVPTRHLMKLWHHSTLSHIPRRGKRRAKIKFAAQLKLATPSFVLFVTNADLVNASYLRYLENLLRRMYPFVGTPIRFFVRPAPLSDSVVARRKALEKRRRQGLRR